jgi:hypothetical protein
LQWPCPFPQCPWQQPIFLPNSRFFSSLRKPPLGANFFLLPLQFLTLRNKV